MNAIKNFIYLDEYKMYSISAQIFEGITGYLMNYKERSIQEQEQQEGEVDSGRVMSDILKFESGTQEKKYLHDYAYTLFEKHLEDSNRLFSIHTESLKTITEEVQRASFVKITSKVVFEDIKKVKSVIERFNELGEAIAYMGYSEELKNSNQSKPNRNKKSSTSRHFIRNLAKDQGLYQDGDFLEKLALILDFGFQDQFKLLMDIGQYSFEADCNRKCFREDEFSLIRKYSRFPQMEFVLVGIITQWIGESEKHESQSSKPDSIKGNIKFLTHALSDIESEFSGKLKNDIIIDPIAIYSEL